MGGALSSGASSGGEDGTAAAAAAAASGTATAASGTAVAGIISEARVTELVDRFMSDNSINSAFLPDFVERALYANVIRLMLSVTAVLLDTSDVRLLGHRIRLRLEPS
jgi:hypothetical protein